MCDHKCHKVGLNPWVLSCPICGCPNALFNPNVSAPETFDELLNWNHPDPTQRPERYRNL